MVNITEFLPWVLPKTPGCSTPLALQAIVDAALTFCQESTAVRTWLSPISTVAGTAEYPLAGTASERVLRVLDVHVDGTLVYPMPAVFDAALTPDVSGNPTRYYARQAGEDVQLVLYPTPDKVYSVDVQVSNGPRRTATEVADDLLHLWLEPVVAGAVSRVLMIPGQPFTDPASAAFYGAQAVSGMRKARVSSDLGRVRATTSVSMRPFA